MIGDSESLCSSGRAFVSLGGRCIHGGFLFGVARTGYIRKHILFITRWIRGTYFWVKAAARRNVNSSNDEHENVERRT